jgi:hypothetical protein
MPNDADLERMDKMPNEFETRLKEAFDIGVTQQVSQIHGTRAHSIAMTHLETAQLWAKYDREEKERVGT